MSKYLKDDIFRMKQSKGAGLCSCVVSASTFDGEKLESCLVSLSHEISKLNISRNDCQKCMESVEDSRLAGDDIQSPAARLCQDGQTGVEVRK